MEVPLLPEREEERKWVVVVLPRLSFLEELKTLSFLSAPPAGVACFRFFLLATATMMVGHLGKLSLDSIAIANSLINVIGFIPLFGFASALETLCGQAYGAEQYQKIGTYTYPAMFFCIAILCLLFPITKVSNGGHMRFCTRVANELGAGNPEPARLSTCVVIFLAVAEAAIGSVALFCCRNVLAYLFNTDKDVVNYVSELVPLLSTAIFMDSMQSVLSGQNPIILSGLLFSLFSLS
ncbi:protein DETOXIFICATION 2 [Citrus sinensis]|uniref:Protein DETOXIFICATION 2 n=1 Tax=Citrus sinensis TaxID=2711 RepID=A0ACB8K3H9_CITSI|nr:protein DETOXIFICATION 2 [Citrus sinensis]